MRKLGAAALIALSLVGCGSPAPVPVGPVPEARASLSLRPNPVQVGQDLEVLLGVEGGAVGTRWHATLLMENNDGEIQQLLPNRVTPDFTVVSGETRRFPPEGAGFRLVAAPPTGLSIALLMLTPSAPNLAGVSAYANDQSGFATVLEAGSGRLNAALLPRLRAQNPAALFATDMLAIADR